MKKKQLVKKLRTIAMDLREPHIIGLAIEHQCKKLEEIADQISDEPQITTRVSGAGTGKN